MFDIIRAWNSYCLKNNNILDCIYSVNNIANIKTTYKYYKILPYEPYPKTYSSLTEALDDVDFSHRFSAYVTYEYDYVEN